MQSLLYTSGIAIILFSLWSGVRDLGILFDRLKKDPELQEILEGRNYSILLGALFIIVIACSILLHLYIGRKAMQVSLGKSRGKAYIVLAAVMLILSLITYVSDFKEHQLFAGFEIDQIVLLVIDLTSNVILGEIVVCSVLLNRWRDRGCR